MRGATSSSTDVSPVVGTADNASDVAVLSAAASSGSRVISFAPAADKHVVSAFAAERRLALPCDWTEAYEPFFGDGSTRSEKDLVQGEVVITGNIPIGTLSTIGMHVDATIAQVVGVDPSFVHTSYHTFNYSTEDQVGRATPRINARWEYTLLPPINGAGQAVDLLINSRNGMPHPIRPTPIFMSFLQYKVQTWPTTADLPVAGWEQWIGTPVICTHTGVWHPYNMPVATTTTPAPIEYRPAQYESQVNCNLAGLPCGCAMMEQCTWDTVNHVCQEGRTVVPCSACNKQLHCPITTCEQITSECQCMASTLTCRWDTTSYGCVDREGGSTPCTACAAQPHCDPPDIRFYDPMYEDFLLLEQDSIVKVTFDTPIILSSYTEVVFDCEPAHERLMVPRDGLSIYRKDLKINASALHSAQSSVDMRCQLLIGEGTVRDQAHVPFLGLYPGGYVFRLRETKPPQISRTEPFNGQNDVSLDAILKLWFDEPINFPLNYRELRFVLSVLDDSSTYEEAATTFSYIAMNSPQVRIRGNCLEVDITGSAVSMKLHSLTLPYGAVVDEAGNNFEGLPERVFIFRTAAALITLDASKDDPTQFYIFIGSCATAAALGVLLLGFIGRTIHLHIKNRNHQRKMAEQQAARSLENNGRTSKQDIEALFVEPILKPDSQPPLFTVDDLGSTISSRRSFGATSTPTNSVPTSPTGKDSRRSMSFDGPREAARSSVKHAGSNASLDSTWGSTASFTSEAWAAPPTMPPVDEPRKGKMQQRSKTSLAAKVRKVSSVAPDPGVPPSRRSATQEYAGLGTESEPTSPTSPFSPFSPGSTVRGRPSEPSSPTSPTSPATGAGSARQRASQGPFPQQQPVGGNPGQPQPPPQTSPQPPQQPPPQRQHTSAQQASSVQPPPRQGSAGKGGGQASGNAESAQQQQRQERQQQKQQQQQQQQQQDQQKRSSRRASTVPPRTSSRSGTTICAQTQKVEKQLRDMMSAPIADRKKALRELMLEYHPDKNRNKNATEVFQFINASRSWFLCDTKQSNSNATKAATG